MKLRMSSEDYQSRYRTLKRLYRDTLERAGYHLETLYELGLGSAEVV